MPGPRPDTLDELERLQHQQAVKQAELGGVKYAIFTVRQAIGGRTMYPLSEAVRREIESHRRRLADLTRQEAALSSELADIASRMTQIREALEVHH